MIKCKGCGVTIQFDDSNAKGYINKETYDRRIENNQSILCERCFRLKNYNEDIKVEIDEESFYDLVKEMFEFIINYEGVIPGASAIECGNYLDLNLSMAKFYAKKYKKEVLENFIEEKYIYK